MIIDTFVCDYGGVVSDHYSEPYQGQLASALGVTKKRLRELLSERSPHGRLYRLDRMSKTQFWIEVMKLAGKVGLDEDNLQDLWAKTYIPNAAVLSLLSHIKDQLEVQTAIVMNEDRWRYEYVLERYDMKRYAPVIIASFEVGAIKPEEPIYREVLTRVNRRSNPERVLYVDDRQTHVDAAKACGMNGYLHINPGELAGFVDTISLVKFQPDLGKEAP
ncbi:MAG TPA: HAD-IA family hydrolase [Pyrinomonadaceae bacterium]|jgi:FMN phosphatase YigB (HAD superfamily)|nr:HAD-IA family hydrolase [Pyrinomonadaceae bacterium]